MAPYGLSSLFKHYGINHLKFLLCNLNKSDILTSPLPFIEQKAFRLSPTRGEHEQQHNDAVMNRWIQEVVTLHVSTVSRIC